MTDVTPQLDFPARYAVGLDRGSTEPDAVFPVESAFTRAGFTVVIEPTDWAPWRAFFQAQSDVGAELSGIFSCPNDRWICVVAGGYAHVVDAFSRTRVVEPPLEEVKQVVSCVDDGIMVFVGHVSAAAMGTEGVLWETRRLSWDGLVIDRVEGGEFVGRAWDALNQTEVPVRIDMRRGEHRGGAAPLV